jgi:uncharacterized secreted protein with C-terminal beta-propeller domain
VNDDELEARLAGSDGPRPLPDDLVEDLVALLGGTDPVARLTGIDGPAPLTPAVADRLQATLTSASPSRGFRGPWTPQRAVAVAAVVLLLAGGVTAYGSTRTADRRVGVSALGPARTTTTTSSSVPAHAAEDGETGVSTAPESAPAPPPPEPRPTPPGPPAAPALIAYRSCDDLLATTKERALAVVGPYGLAGSSSRGVPVDSRSATAGPASAPASADAAGEAAADEASSGTNVQEAGVDEADLVKTDGRRIVTVTDNVLHVVRVDRGRLTTRATHTFPEGTFAAEALLTGNRVVVFGSASSAPDGDAGRRAWSVVWILDITDDAAPRVQSTLYLDGVYRTARLVGGRVQLVMTSAVGPQFVYPMDGSPEAQDRATAQNREIVARSVADDWSPAYVLLDGTDPATARRGRMCGCDDTLRPRQFTGSETVTVLAIDPARPDPQAAAAVQGAAETVYASPSNLYVGTDASRFAKTPSAVGATTTVHRFDISGAAPAYRGSGQVRGRPLNQFSLSERAGHLRVATTDQTVVDEGGTARSRTESFVTVLAVRSEDLAEVGQVGGLGHGELIQSVRFLDDLGYVVTFRRTDPLYVVDLADPARPALRGELKVPGFSAYLHPIGDGFLLGVGMDAADDGRTTGAQISSFDVRDPAAPTQVDRLSFGARTSTPVGGDHHAFLYWGPTSTAVVPVTPGDGSTTDAVVLAVGADRRLARRGSISHAGQERAPDRSPGIVRSLVVGDHLYTVSSAGVLASDLATLEPRSWQNF